MITTSVETQFICSLGCITKYSCEFWLFFILKCPPPTSPISIHDPSHQLHIPWAWAHIPIILVPMCLTPITQLHVPLTQTIKLHVCLCLWCSKCPIWHMLTCLATKPSFRRSFIILLLCYVSVFTLSGTDFQCYVSNLQMTMINNYSLIAHRWQMCV